MKRVVLIAVISIAIGFTAGYFLAPRSSQSNTQEPPRSIPVDTLRPNPICWVEIAVADMPRAVKFYETVLGIKLLDYGAPDNMMFFPEYKGSYGSTAALCYAPDQFTPSKDGAVIYFASVSGDLANELSRVETAGGKIIYPKTFISEDMGYFAWFEDSEGNRIAMFSKK